MAAYYVHTVAQPNGDHEVHVAGCTYLPSKENRIYLGEFNNCADAVKQARQHYDQVNGCYFCSRPCHTT